MNWKDCTTYSRNDKERKPTTFEISHGGLRICVTNGHIHYRGQWVMHCYALGIDTLPIPTGLTKEQAQNEALCIVGKKLAALEADYQHCTNK